MECQDREGSASMEVLRKDACYTMKLDPLCGVCKTSCKYFKKVVQLKNSGLAIYASENYLASTAAKKSDVATNSESFILHNMSEKQITKKDYMNEFDEYKTNCNHCNSLIQKVRSLLVELSDIEEDEVRAVCSHCQQKNTVHSKCKRCEQIVHRYVTHKLGECKESQSKIKDWLARIRVILQSLLERDNVCRHNTYHESSNAEIKRLFQELTSDTNFEHHQPKIEKFPEAFGMPCFKERLQEHLSKRAEMESSDLGSGTSNQKATSCACKYFLDKNIEGRGSIEVLFRDKKREPGPSTLREKLSHRKERVDWDFRYPASDKRDYRYDSDERDFRYSGRHERDYRYPGRDERNYRYPGRDDRDLPYKSDSRVYRYPGRHVTDYDSPGRDDIDYRFPDLGKIDYSYARDDKGTRDLRKTDREYRFPDYRYDTEYRSTDRDDRDSRHAGRDYRDHRYPGRDDKDYRSFDRDDKGARYAGRDDREARGPGRDRDYRSLDRDDEDRRYAGRDDREYRSLGRDDRDISHPRRYDSDSRITGRDARETRGAGRDDRETRDLGRDDRGYRSPGREDRDSRYTGKDDKEARGTRKDDRNTPRPREDDRDTRQVGKDDRDYRSPGKDDRDTRQPRRDEKDFRSPARDDRETHRAYAGKDDREEREMHDSRRGDKATSEDKEYPPSGKAGRANRYGRHERDVKDNEFYFPKSEAMDSRHPSKDKGTKDRGSSDRDEEKSKSKEEEKRRAKEEVPQKNEMGNAEEKKMRTKQNDTSGEMSGVKEKQGRRKEGEKFDEKDRRDKEYDKKEISEKAGVKSSKEDEKDKRKEEETSKNKDIKQATREKDSVEDITEAKSAKDREKNKTKDREYADGKAKRDAKVGTDRIKNKNIDESSKHTIKEAEASLTKDTKDKENKKTAKKKGKGKTKEEEESPKEELEKSPKEVAEKKPQITSEERLMLKMMNERKEKREKEQVAKKDQEIKLPSFEDLPEIKIPEPEIEVEVSESVIICGDQKPYRPKVMIKGDDIVPYNSHYKDEQPETNLPLLFKTHPECPPPVIDVLHPTEPSISSAKDKQSKGDKKADIAPPSGIIKYQLSNTEFIDKGWTVLPTTKVMRRMTIYKMLPVNSNCNWFTRHISIKQVFYDTGERLAEINEDGTGQWYYKSGSVALDHYNSEDPFTNQRYVIYSQGNDIETGEMKSVTILASFDCLGNGVVYDYRGNVRLKYNQSEGMVVDEKIGPPGVWKWHILNDPPVLEPMFLNTRSKHPDPRVQALSEQSDKDTKSSAKTVKSVKSMIDKSKSVMRDEKEEMVAIELENFAKLQAFKITQKFKPFQITRKIFKINDYFSLKILDQTNIYLMFRGGQISLKLNLGMQLVSTEIIDSDTTETVHVPTPYDVLPPKSASLAHIQSHLMKAKKGK